MTNSKVPGAGADWTELLTDPDLVSHLGELLRTYRESSPEKRDQALLDAMRKIKSSKNSSNEAPSERSAAETKAEVKPATPVESLQPVTIGPENSPPFAPDYFTPSSWQDRRRYPRMKCFVAVELHVGDSASPIWGNLSNTSIGGCFVETATAVPSGANVEIGLWLANGKVWIKGIILNGVVTKSTPSFGVRVKFSDLEPSARESLRHFLKFVESTTREHSNEHAYLEKLKR